MLLIGGLVLVVQPLCGQEVPLPLSLMPPVQTVEVPKPEESPIPGELRVWTLDAHDAVGDEKPQLLGSPRIAETAEYGRALWFNGLNDGLVVSHNPIAGWPVLTVEVLFKPESGGEEEQRFFHIEDEGANRILLETRTANDSWCLDTFMKMGDTRTALIDYTKQHATGRWYWVAATCDGETLAHYIDGVQEVSAKVKFVPFVRGRTSVGVRMNQIHWFKGHIREVRFHPRVLTSTELQRVR